MSTSLAEDELLTEVRLPLLPPDTRFGFYEFSRRAGDYAIAMSLVTFRMLDGVMADVRVGIGGAEGKPRRCSAAEAALSGQSPTEKSFSDAGEAAAAALDPMEDAQSRGQYRRDLVRTVVRRASERAAA